MKYKIFQSEHNKKYYFHFEDKDANLMLKSPGYEDRASCEKGVKSVLANAPNGELYNPQQAADGRFFFDIKNPKGEVIGTSSLYKTTDEAEAAINKVLNMSDVKEVVIKEDPNKTEPVVAPSVGVFTKGTLNSLNVAGYEEGDQYYFDFKQGGDAILESQSYTSQAACQNGIESVMKNAADPTKYKIHQTKDGQYYFDLVAGNNQVIGTSVSFTSEAALYAALGGMIGKKVSKETFESKSAVGDGSDMPPIEIFKTGQVNNLLFEAYKNNSDSEYYFHFKTQEGRPILVSQGYSSKSGCENGIKSVIQNATNHKNFDLKTSPDGKHYFNLEASNGQAVGTSIAFDNKKEMSQIISWLSGSEFDADNIGKEGSGISTINKIVGGAGAAIAGGGIINSLMDGKDETEDTKSEIDQAKLDIEKAQKELDTTIIRTEEVTKGKLEIEQAKAEIEKTKKELSQVDKGIRQEEVQKTKDEIKEAQSDIDKARADLKKAKEEALLAEEKRKKADLEREKADKLRLEEEKKKQIALDLKQKEELRLSEEKRKKAEVLRLEEEKRKRAEKLRLEENRKKAEKLRLEKEHKAKLALAKKKKEEEERKKAALLVSQKKAAAATTKTASTASTTTKVVGAGAGAAAVAKATATARPVAASGGGGAFGCLKWLIPLIILGLIGLAIWWFVPGCGGQGGGVGGIGNAGTAIVDKTKNATNAVVDKTKNATNAVVDKTKETANAVVDKTKETANAVVDKTKEAIGGDGDSGNTDANAGKETKPESKKALGPDAKALGFRAGTMEAKMADFMSDPNSRGPKTFNMEKISWPTNSPKMNQAAYAQVANLAKLMKKYPDMEINIVGHRDRNEIKDYNHKGEIIGLDEIRARCLYRKLKPKGIATNRMKWGGAPATDHRRLEVTITKK